MKFSKKFFQEAGRKGGKATLENNGVEHFSKIGQRKRKSASRVKKGAAKPSKQGGRLSTAAAA